MPFLLSSGIGNCNIIDVLLFVAGRCDLKSQGVGCDLVKEVESASPPISGRSCLPSQVNEKDESPPGHSRVGHGHGFITAPEGTSAGSAQLRHQGPCAQHSSPAAGAPGRALARPVSCEASRFVGKGPA